MRDFESKEVWITGIGITSAIGQGKNAFCANLMAGQHAFRIMHRSGRQKNSAFLGAEISSLQVPENFFNHARRVSLSGQAAALTIEEAWKEAHLDEVPSDRIGLIIGGSNLQQREQLLIHEKFRDDPYYIIPHYGLSFLDTDLCGICTEKFGIKGLAYTVGGASASGHLAILQAIEAVLSGRVDVCIALGALMDLSYFELHALRSLGAMGSDRFAQEPEQACRPFDQKRDGFIFGESCGAVVIERSQAVPPRNVRPYANIVGWGMGMDAHRNPDPSHEGEVSVIQAALKQANISAEDIDYVNPHGSGSKIGDEIELGALIKCGLSHARINATKSITGHGLSAAGTVEVIATLLQMQASQLHPTLNLETPIQPELNWVYNQPLTYSIDYALNLSIGFSGINTALCLKNYQTKTHEAIGDIL